MSGAIGNALNSNAASIGTRSAGVRSGTAKLPTLTLEQSRSYGQLPLSFEVNQGQTDSQVQFLARGSSYTLFLTKNEAVMQLPIADFRSQVRESAPTTTWPFRSKIRNPKSKIFIID